MKVALAIWIILFAAVDGSAWEMGASATRRS